MSGIHYRNGGYITSAKPTLTRSRGSTTINWSYSPAWNAGQTAIVDRSSANITPSNNGTVYNSATAFSGTNSGSIYHDNAGDYVDATSSNFTFGTGDFTIMGWFNLSSYGTYSCLFEGASGGGGRTGTFVWLINSSGKLALFSAGLFQFEGSSTVSTNTWNHLALIRSSGVIKCYLNGTLEAQTSTAIDVNTNFCRFGRIGDDSNGFTGKVSNYIVLKGTALYTGNFTPNSTNEETASRVTTANVNTTTYGVYKLGY